MCNGTYTPALCVFFKVNEGANVTLAMKAGTANTLKTKTDTASVKAALNAAEGATPDH
jgi:hypothetical protein